MRLFPALLAIAIVTGALVGSDAWAYRPSLRTLLTKSLDRAFERGTKSLKVESEIQAYDDAGRPRGATVTERHFIQAPNKFRRETEGDGGVVIEIRSDGKSLRKAQGQADKAGKAPIDLLVEAVVASPPLLPEQVADRLISGMKSLGVNTEVVSFARFDGRVAYLVGSKPWEVDKPQVWIDKETLLLVRVVTFQKEGRADGAPSRIDVRYLGWGSAVGGNWYPATVEVWRDDKLVRRAVTQQVEKNAPMEAALFALR